MRLVRSPLTEEIINRITVLLFVICPISIMIWILRLTADFIKVILIVLLQILGAMGIGEIRENVIFKFMEASLLAANCCFFMVIMPKH